MARAQRIAPYRAIQKRYRPGRREFERLVAEALDELPREFREHLNNVAIVVADQPSPRERGAAEDGATLLGLYHGTALPQRDSGYHLAPPDRITLYRLPILASARSRQEVTREIRATLIHEIGHYFGLEERELP